MSTANPKPMSDGYKVLDRELVSKFKANHLLTPGGPADTAAGRVVNLVTAADALTADVDAFGDAVDTFGDDIAALVVPSETVCVLDAAIEAVAAMQTDPTVIGDGSYDLKKIDMVGDAIAYGVTNTGAVALKLKGAPSGTEQVTHIVFLPPGSGVTSLSCDSSLGQYDNPLVDFDPSKMYAVYISRWVSGSDYVHVVTGKIIGA